MQIDLRQVFQTEGFSEKISLDIDWTGLEYGNQHPFVEPVRLTGVIENRAEMVRIDYTAEFNYHTLCDRCSSSLTESYLMDFSHVLVSSLAGEDDSELILVENYMLDIDELALSDILLELPMKHLCSDDCKGLCPMCGKNLNEEQCGCKEDTCDPRLAVLRKLLEE